jgi:hypothetical protein
MGNCFETSRFEITLVLRSYRIFGKVQVSFLRFFHWQCGGGRPSCSLQDQPFI